MQRLFEYIGHHPFLAGGAVLAALVVIAVEIKERIQKFADAAGGAPHEPGCAAH
jgi:hypothetical protein